MKWMELEYIKMHSRLDYDCEDQLLEHYAESAEDTVLNLIGRTYEELIEKYGKVPAPIMQATLMLVDVSYTYRSPDSPVPLSLVPYSFDILIKPYVKL